MSALQFVTENLGVPFKVKGWGNQVYVINRICDGGMFAVENSNGHHEGFIYEFALNGPCIKVEGWLMGEKVTASFDPKDVILVGKEVAA